MNKYLTLALPKGRLGDSALEQFDKIGWTTSIQKDSRKLVFIDEVLRIRFMFVKPADVITYVENGVADLGVIGKDSILEEEADVYELLDFGFGKCKFSIAGQKNFQLHQKDSVLKIATKYPRVTLKYFASRNQSIEIIKLNGSVELAPLVGLSDVIVDIVETGGTLKANGLEILEDMMDISAKLIANRVSYRFKHDRIQQLIQLLQEQKEVTT
ncbi:MAG: ATP phosphoribosyltransferase [Candidatus Izemoplasmatales bacterium]|jgi:ATP phosphoribosyltransferase|nr:ATP phosphoribosyltransferase [bacterium]MDZ4195737.1 ATP phosphoribosyltransferase [Candidatus Izemoplasmatales bacterium]